MFTVKGIVGLELCMCVTAVSLDRCSVANDIGSNFVVCLLGIIFSDPLNDSKFSLMAGSQYTMLSQE